jgi:hypothetical protein
MNERQRDAFLRVLRRKWKAERKEVTAKVAATRSSA